MEILSICLDGAPTTTADLGQQPLIDPEGDERLISTLEELEKLEAAESADIQFTTATAFAHA